MALQKPISYLFLLPNSVCVVSFIFKYKKEQMV